MTTVNESPPGSDREKDLIGYEAELELDLIHPSSENPRKTFSEDALAQLAESLKTHGQMQNVVVRLDGPEQYELIGGERRWRAARLAELPTLRCRVIRCDDATAVELRGVENYRREQLNAIEEAIWFDQMLETGRYDQASLAEYLGVSQGQVSNRLRLLKLPEEWQSWIMDGSLPPTHARELLPWVEFPTVLARLAEHHRTKAFRDESVGELQLCIENVVFQVSRPMSGRKATAPKFEQTEEVIRDLNCVEVKLRYQSESSLRAFNVELWDKLQAEAKAAATAKADTDVPASDDNESGGGGGGTAGGIIDTPKRADDESYLSQRGLENCWQQHMNDMLAAVVARSKGTDLAVRLFVCVGQELDRFVDMLADKRGIKSEDDPRPVDAFIWGMTTGRQRDLPACIKEFIVDDLQNRELYHWQKLFTLEALVAMCRDLQIDYRGQFQPTPELLDHCSTDQLRELVTDDMGKPAQVKRWGRERLLKELQAQWPSGYVPVLLVPERLLKAENPAQETTDGENE